MDIAKELNDAGTAMEKLEGTTSQTHAAKAAEMMMSLVEKNSRRRNGRPGKETIDEIRPAYHEDHTANSSAEKDCPEEKEAAGAAIRWVRAAIRACTETSRASCSAQTAAAEEKMEAAAASPAARNSTKRKASGKDRRDQVRQWSVGRSAALRHSQPLSFRSPRFQPADRG